MNKLARSLTAGMTTLARSTCGACGRSNGLCEGNDTLARVDLGGAHAIVTAATGKDPDVMSVDSGPGWLYVAAESGDLSVFDINQPGLVAIDREHPGDNTHTVAVDPATHRVFFPLMVGPKGTPVLRIMRPKTLPSTARNGA